MNNLYPQFFYKTLFRIALAMADISDRFGRWVYLQTLKRQGCNPDVFSLDNWKK